MRERVATMLDTVTPAVLRLRRVTYPQKVCISVWTAPPCRSKGVMQAKTCVEVLDLSPGSRAPGEELFRPIRASSRAAS